MVAHKFYSDVYLLNEDYAKVAGMSNPELNLLEHEFLGLIGFDLYISEESYCSYHKKLGDFAASIKFVHIDRIASSESNLQENRGIETMKKTEKIEEVQSGEAH